MGSVPTPVTTISALAHELYPWIRATGARIVGINGPQGAGKSTLTAALVDRAAAEGHRWVSLSIDDVYLTRAEQRALAEAHPADPLLAVRGAPGTHDVALGVELLDALLGPEGEVRVPRYDKSAHGGLGDRRPRAEWSTIALPVEVVLFEGWTLAFSPQGVGGALAGVEARLHNYAPWTRRLQALIQLRMSDPTSVLRWRVEAEARMRACGRPGMSDAEATAYVARFLPLYEVYPQALTARPPPIPTRVIWLGPDRNFSV